VRCSFFILSTMELAVLLLPTIDLKALSALPDSSASCLNFSANCWRAFNSAVLLALRSVETDWQRSKLTVPPR